MVTRSSAAMAVQALATISAFSLSIAAAPTSVDDDNSQIITILVKRKPTLKGSDSLSVDNKVPVDALILIGGGLVVALLCFCFALFNIKAPSASGQRRIRDERAQAKTELRLKGGGGTGTSGSTSPTRNMMMEKKRHLHQSNATSATVSLSVESHSRLMTNMPSPGRAGPKIASDFLPNSRASRGYSSFSKSDIAKMGSHFNSPSMLAVPTLMTNAANAAADNASLPGSSAASSGGSTSHYNQQRPQWHSNNSNRPSTLHDRSNSFQERQTSNTLGRGVDLNVNRSKTYKSRNNIHVNPQAVVPSYSRRGSTQPPYSSASHGTSHDMQDPLTGYDVKRFSENNNNQTRDALPKNTSINALDFFGYGSNGNPIYSNRAYNDSGSESMSHEATAFDGTSTPSALPRTKQMYFYEQEQDGQQSPGGLHQDSALLHYTQQSQYASPTKAGRRVWDNSANNHYNRF